MNLKLALYALVILGGLVSAFETRVAVFAFLALVIACAALTRLTHPRKKWLGWGLGVAVACCAVGLCRFMLQEAMPGITEAHGRASSARAVSFLREILFAEDALRRHALIDPDGDRVGGAGLLGELTGAPSPRATSSLRDPVLAPRYTPRVGTASGPAVLDGGYLYLVCLPNKGGGWTASPSGEVDEERAERRWIAYAWPSDAGLGHEFAYFIDEHETILETPNQDLRLLGAQKSPSCEDALGPPHVAQYRVWRNKKARAELPGDPASPGRP